MILGRLFCFLLLCLVVSGLAMAQEDDPLREDHLDEALLRGESDEPDPDEPIQVDDDTPEVETESTIDSAVEKRGWILSGDLRAIYDYVDLEARDGEDARDDGFGFRFRGEAMYGLTRGLKIGARIAGTCVTDRCDGDIIFESATPEVNGLRPGQITLDELFIHWFRRERVDVAVGRLQTRFVLRGGVYAKSLDRNDSNNVNITWTDGMHATYKARNNWHSHFVLQRNVSSGTGSIRRGDFLNYESSTARNTWFYGLENYESWGLITQRSFDVSYLPDSLVKDGDPADPREDYLAFVGRLAMRWPQRTEGPRLRAGAELGYAPETPTNVAGELPGAGDLDGLAWNIVASIMEFKPGHSIGLNYGWTGGGWLLSPQFRPNDELLEIRYQWNYEDWPLIEIRARQREDIEQRLGTNRKRDEFDFYARVTWQF